MRIFFLPKDTGRLENRCVGAWSNVKDGWLGNSDRWDTGSSGSKIGAWQGGREVKDKGSWGKSPGSSNLRHLLIYLTHSTTINCERTGARSSAWYLWHVLQLLVPNSLDGVPLWTCGPSLCSGEAWSESSFSWVRLLKWNNSNNFRKTDHRQSWRNANVGSVGVAYRKVAWNKSLPDSSFYTLLAGA